MVKPTDTLRTTLEHVGMRKGRMMIEVVTVNQLGEAVLKATAEVLQPSTAYIFTGQGASRKQPALHAASSRLLSST